MLSPPKISNSIEACLWKHHMVGVLTIWKLGHTRFQMLGTRAIPPKSEGAVVAVDFERVILETIASMANPPRCICVQTLTEVEVVACDSQDAIALHRERTDELPHETIHIKSVQSTLETVQKELDQVKQQKDTLAAKREAARRRDGARSRGGRQQAVGQRDSAREQVPRPSEPPCTGVHRQGAYVFGDFEQATLVHRKQPQGSSAGARYADHQLTNVLMRIQTLKSQFAEQEATYSSETAGLRRLVSVMDERDKQAKEIMDNIEKDYEGVNDRAERQGAVLREEIVNQRQREEDAEKRVEELQAVLDRMDRGEFPISAFAGSVSTPGTPARSISVSTPARNGSPSADFQTRGMFGLSPTVAMASHAQMGGKSFTEAHSDYISSRA
ncbi:hypothetical protein LXA43DRAFT_1062503, partial [Ganoderma leucocontextum]